VSPYSRVCCRAENDGKGEVKMDPIEKLVSFFVGKEAVMEADKDPSGLQRLTGAALSEQYEAPTDVFADAVDGDDDEVADLFSRKRSSRPRRSSSCTAPTSTGGMRRTFTLVLTDVEAL